MTTGKTIFLPQNTLEEVCVYKVHDGKIVFEQFFRDL